MLPKNGGSKAYQQAIQQSFCKSVSLNVITDLNLFTGVCAIWSVSITGESLSSILTDDHSISPMGSLATIVAGSMFRPALTTRHWPLIKASRRKFITL